MDKLIHEYTIEHPNSIIFYQLSLGSGQDAFVSFHHFYTALKTVPNALCDHYSIVKYTDATGIMGTFRLKRDGVFTKSTSTTLAEVTCDNRSRRVDVIAIESVRSEPYSINTFELVRTELLEIWEFRVDNVLYIMEKSGTGITKMDASKVEPTFQIRIKHANPNTMLDLFGKYSDTPTGTLHVIHKDVSTRIGS